MAKVFIVEDDAVIRKELATLLSKYGYECVVTDVFENIVDIILASKPQMVLLDINLPYFDGYYVCRELRRVSGVPIIVVTSRTGEMDELMSMNLGADDFITKPYNTQILLARMEAIFRRVEGSHDTQCITYKAIVLDIFQGIVSCKERETELSKNETKLLHLLIKNKNRIVSRQEMINELWQSDAFVDDNTLTVNINRLRKKLESIGAEHMLMTKRGQGYML